MRLVVRLAAQTRSISAGPTPTGEGSHPELFLWEALGRCFAVLLMGIIPEGQAGAPNQTGPECPQSLTPSPLPSPRSCCSALHPTPLVLLFSAQTCAAQASWATFQAAECFCPPSLKETPNCLWLLAEGTGDEPLLQKAAHQGCRPGVQRASPACRP